MNRWIYIYYEIHNVIYSVHSFWNSVKQNECKRKIAQIFFRLKTIIQNSGIYLLRAHMHAHSSSSSKKKIYMFKTFQENLRYFDFIIDAVTLSSCLLLYFKTVLKFIVQCTEHL